MKSKSGRHQARIYALQALYQWEMTKSAPEKIMEEFIFDDEVKHIDSPYFKELLLEVITKQVDLDQQIAPLLDRKLTELDPVERNTLRIATYELLHRAEIPYKVVLNEAIELTKNYGTVEGHKYVNGVLDRLAKKIRHTEM